MLSTNKSILDDDDDSSHSSNEDTSPLDTNELNTDATVAKRQILLLQAELKETNRMLKEMETDLKIASSNGQNTSKTINRCERENPCSSKTIVPDEIAEINQNQDFVSKHDDMVGDIEQDSVLHGNISILSSRLQNELDDYIDSVQQADKKRIIDLQNQVRQLEAVMKGKHRNEEQRLQSDGHEWEVLQTLHPPPDHDLRSPIVTALLSDWTHDRNTHEALIGWIEQILNGADPSHIPPLHISGLNDQLRDGFSMHILPFISKRSDINIEVSSRVQYEKMHDILVSIKTNDLSTVRKNKVSLAAKSAQLIAFKASVQPLDDSTESNTLPYSTHSANNEERSNNSSSQDFQNRRSEHSSFFRSSNLSTTSGVVAGAWNAMGCLLSPRKQPISNEVSNSKIDSSICPSTFAKPSVDTDFVMKNQFLTTESMHDNNEPYHRVVSAPPGRIGITFVQYRGHAMVSDVYQDSPLLGWIFPSDIVIAIDEVLVSGMRVADIVKILTSRKGRQRALRVISSHSMTELMISERSGRLKDDE